MFRLSLLATALAALVACSSAPPAPEPAQVAAPEPEPVVQPEVPERPIPADSLYPLLVAEFALRRQAYDVALDQYVEQSQRLRDAGVSAHTTHLAQFLQREPEARQAVQLWLELEPDNLEANNTMANLLVRQGRPLDAIPHMARVQRQGKTPNYPSLLNGFDQLGAEQQAELVQGINELAQEFPGNTQILLTQAIILADFQRYDQALQKLDELLTLEPYQPQAVLLEARILLASKSDKPYERLQEALARNPQNSTLRLQYARLLTTSDMEAARDQFEILSAQSPRDGDLLLSLALINREVGDDAAASGYLKRLVALEQRLDEAHYYLGRIAEDSGDTETALTEYMKVSDGREYLSANSHIGQILVAGDQLPESQAWFARQRATNPQRREQLYGLEADILTRADKAQAAMAVLNQGLEEFPESANLRYARSMLGEQQDDLALMESDLRAILATDPDNATALNALGYTLANRTDRYDEAYALIARALELQPDEPAILDSMGWVLYRLDRYDEALDYLKRAYAVFPDPEVAAHLGEVLWVSGDTNAATDVWRGALVNAPDHEVLLDTLKRFGMSSLAGTLPSGAPAQARP